MLYYWLGLHHHIVIILIGNIRSDISHVCVFHEGNMCISYLNEVGSHKPQLCIYIFPNNCVQVERASYTEGSCRISCEVEGA